MLRHDEDKQAVLLTFLGSKPKGRRSGSCGRRAKACSGIPGGAEAKEYAPIPEDERALLGNRSVWDQAAICDLATTVLRQGLSTAIASSEARMFAPAATMNTLSHVPDDCCM